MSRRPAKSLLSDLRASQAHVAFLFFLCFTFSYIDRQVVSILVQPLQHGLNLSDIQIGVLQGFSFTLCYATAGVLVAYLVDRSNRVRLAVICVIIWSLSTAACGFSQNFGQLLLVRAGTAIAEAGIGPAAISIFSDIYTGKRVTRANSLFMLGPYIGGGIALFGGGLVLEYLRLGPGLPGLEPWQEVFLIVGLPGLVLALLVAIGVREPARRGADAAPDRGGEKLGGATPHANDITPSLIEVVRELVLRQRFCMPYFVGYMFLIVLFYSYSAWFPTVLIRHFGLSAGQAGSYAGPVFMLGGIFGVTSASILVRDIVDRLVLERVLKLSAKASLCLVPIAALAPTAGWLVLSLLFYGLTAFTASIVMALAPVPIQVALPNRMRGRAIALLVFLTNAVGGGVGPYAVGAINEALPRTTDHINTALAIVASAAALGSAVFYFNAARKTLNGRQTDIASLKYR